MKFNFVTAKSSGCWFQYVSSADGDFDWSKTEKPIVQTRLLAEDRDCAGDDHYMVECSVRFLQPATYFHCNDLRVALDYMDAYMKRNQAIYLTPENRAKQLAGIVENGTVFDNWRSTEYMGIK